MTDEGVLLAKAKQGDRQAFGELALLYRKNVYGLAYKMTGSPDMAEEISQEAFIKAYLGLERFAPLHDGSFKAWLLTITAHTCRDYFRKIRRRPVEVSWEDYDEPPLIKDEPGESYLREEQKARVREALRYIPENYRMALILRYQEELDYKEIARVLDLPPGTVGTWIRRGLEMLRKNMLGKGMGVNEEIAAP